MLQRHSIDIDSHQLKFLIIFQSSAQHPVEDPLGSHMETLWSTGQNKEQSVAQMILTSRSIECAWFPEEKDRMATVCEVREVLKTSPSCIEDCSSYSARALISTTLKCYPRAFESAGVLFVVLPSMIAQQRWEVINIASLRFLHDELQRQELQQLQSSTALPVDSMNDERQCTGMCLPASPSWSDGSSSQANTKSLWLLHSDLMSAIELD
jgi:hypothetical protein